MSLIVTAAAMAAAPLLTLHADDPSAPNPDRNAYFGELHIHTSWSIDAYVFGTHAAGPEEAIRFE